MESFIQRFKEKLIKHKKVSIFISLILILLLIIIYRGFIYDLIQPYPTSTAYPKPRTVGLEPHTAGLTEEVYAPYPQAYAPPSFISFPGFFHQTQTTQLPTAEDIKVKEESISIRSKQAEKDFETIKESVEKTYNGEVINVQKYDSDDKLEYKFTVTIPQLNFDKFIDFILKNFNVKSSNITLKYVSVRQERDEITVINQTLDNLDSIETETMRMTDNFQKIDLLMKINDKKMSLVKRLKELKATVEERTSLGEKSLVYFEVVEEKPFKIIPSDYSQRIKSIFRDKVENTVYGAVNILDIIPFIIGLIGYFLKALVIVFAILILYKVFRFLRTILKV